MTSCKLKPSFTERFHKMNLNDIEGRQLATHDSPAIACCDKAKQCCASKLRDVEIQLQNITLKLEACYSLVQKCLASRVLEKQEQNLLDLTKSEDTPKHLSSTCVRSSGLLETQADDSDSWKEGVSMRLKLLNQKLNECNDRIDVFNGIQINVSLQARVTEQIQKHLQENSQAICALNSQLVTLDHKYRQNEVRISSIKEYLRSTAPGHNLSKKHEEPLGRGKLQLQRC